MLRRDLNYIDDGGKWQKLQEEVEASTTNESDKEELLTLKVLEGFIRYCDEKKKKQGFKNRPATTSDQGGEEDYLIKKEQKINIKNKGVKRCVGLGLGPGPGPGPGSTSAAGEKDGDYLSSKRNKQKQKKINLKQKARASLSSSEQQPPADMPEAFKNCINNLGGTQIKLVLRKTIYDTDLSVSHNRLSMSINKLENEFLSEEEEKEVSKENGGMDVILVEPRLEVSKVQLKKWLIGGIQNYVFKTQWHRIASNNPDTLKRNAIIHVWSFRVVSPDRSQLGFALVPVRDEAKDSKEIN